jgi:hypothetical protein
MSMFICRDCGDVHGEENIGYSNSYLCTIDGIGYSERVMGDCPTCGGELEEAYKCEVCEEYNTEDNSYKVLKWCTDSVLKIRNACVCTDCLKRKATPKMALKVGNYELNKEKIELNGFLADTFTTKEIEEILTKELMRKGTIITKAKEYCLNDMSSFAEWVVDEK